MEKKYLQQLKENGIIVISNYFDKKTCNKLIDQIEEFSKTKKVLSQTDEGLGGDLRIFDFEKFSKVAMDFSDDNSLRKIVSTYSNSNLKTKTVLAGKVTYKKSLNTNSGGDWHRDGEEKQLKAMVYLSDVKEENGPFCFIKESKNIEFKRRDGNYSFFQTLFFFFKGLPLKPPRYKNEFIIKNPNIKNKIYKVTATAGTLIIFDGNYIHRGDVITSGLRYSLTNYYFPVSEKTVINSIKNKIKKYVLN